MRAALILGSVLLAAGSAQAAKLTVIAVGGCGDGASSTATRALRDALVANGSSVQTEEETARPLGGLSRGSLADAERLLASARYDLFERGAYDRVGTNLKTALEILELLPPTEARGTGTRDGRVMLALLNVKQSHAAAAEEELGRVLRVNPEFRIDQNLYPPSFRALAERVRSQVKANARYPMVISSQPAGLKVSVDGLPLGATPQTLKLPAGKYRVEASFGGRRGVPKTVAVEARGVVEFDEAIEGSVYADDGPCITVGAKRDDRLAALVRTGSLLDAHQLVAVRFEEPAGGERYLIASVVDATTGEETREARVKVGKGGPPQGAVDGLAKFLATGEAAAPVEAVTGAAVKPKEQIPAAALPVATKEVPLPAKASLRAGAYLAGGAGAVMLVASGYFYVSASAAHSRISTLCTGGSCAEGSRAEVAKLAPQAATESTVGAVLAGVGAAALATGVVLYVLEPARSSSPSAELILLPTGAQVAVAF